MRTIKAVGDTVVVKININKEKKTDGGIILTMNSDKETQSQATVISVGDTVNDIPIGSLVIISRTGIGELFQLDEVLYRAMPKTEVFAVIEEGI
jgi:co-chaperonin GroES (HSP10)